MATSLFKYTVDGAQVVDMCATAVQLYRPCVLNTMEAHKDASFGVKVTPSAGTAVEATVTMQDLMMAEEKLHDMAQMAGEYLKNNKYTVAVYNGVFNGVKKDCEIGLTVNMATVQKVMCGFMKEVANGWQTVSPFVPASAKIEFLVNGKSMAAVTMTKEMVEKAAHQVHMSTSEFLENNNNIVFTVVLGEVKNLVTMMG